MWKTLKKSNFEEISVFEGYNGSRMPKMYSGGVQNIFEKLLNFFTFFHHPLAMFRKRFEMSRPKMSPKWPKSGVWKTLKNRNFEEILIFEGCGGSRMTKMHSVGV